MPSISLKETKNGRQFYEIRCHIKRGEPTCTTRWYIPEGWSKRAIEKEITKVAADFERKVLSGEIVSHREETKRIEAAAAAADAVITVKKYGEQVFIPAKAVQCSRNTINSYKQLLEHHIYPAIGENKLPDVTSAQLTAMLLSLQNKCYKKQSSNKEIAAGIEKPEKRFSHASVVKVYVVLNQLFTMAYMNDVIKQNPMDKVVRPKPRKDEKNDSIQAYTAAELGYIVKCLDNEPLKWRAYIRLLIDTGMRKGECCGLVWKNVDFEHNRITISQNLCYNETDGVYVDTPKNGKTRVIDVDPAVISILKKLRYEQAMSCMSAFVFTKDCSSEPMHPQSPDRYMKKFGEKYGVQNMHPHKLRHSFASVAITHGADIASVSEKLGHADKSVTLNMYTHADEEAMKRASDVFRNAIITAKEA